MVRLLRAGEFSLSVKHQSCRIQEKDAPVINWLLYSNSAPTFEIIYPPTFAHHLKLRAILLIFFIELKLLQNLLSHQAAKNPFILKNLTPNKTVVVNFFYLNFSTSFTEHNIHFHLIIIHVKSFGQSGRW